MICFHEKTEDTMHYMLIVRYHDLSWIFGQLKHCYFWLIRNR
jgi:hypothetical protein